MAGFLEKIEPLLRDNKRVQLASPHDVFAELALVALTSKLEKNQNLVVILPHPKDVAHWKNFLVDNFFHKKSLQVNECPYIATWGNDRFINHAHIRKQRIAAISSLLQEEKSGVIVTTLAGLLQKTLSLKEYNDSRLKLVEGGEYDFDNFLDNLDNLGYQKGVRVTEEGYWAVRGGIVDVFSMNHENPLRLEFVGDYLESIRFYNPGSQSSISEEKRVEVAPASESITLKENHKENVQKLYDCLLSQKVNQHDRGGIINSFNQGVRFSGFDMFTPLFRENESSLLDYISSNTKIVFLKSIEASEVSYQRFLEDSLDIYERDISDKKPSIRPSEHFSSFEIKDFDKLNTTIIEFGNPYETKSIEFLRFDQKMLIESFPQPKNIENELFKNWVSFIKTIQKKYNTHVSIVFHTQEMIDKTKSLLEHHGIRSFQRKHALIDVSCGKPIGEEGVSLSIGSISSYIWLEESSTFLLPEEKMFGSVSRKKKESPEKLRDYLKSFRDLKINDLVVHINYGIGRYTGMQTLSLGGVTSDFLVIEYHGKDKIYLPVDKLNLLQKYNSSVEGVSARLDKLGGQAWEKKKSKVKSAIKDMAEDLLRVQAQKKLSQAVQYQPEGETFQAFVDDFPYEETSDQLKVLSEIDMDLVSDKSMDRLVVGDVGFGKTEVAIRAAFRAVLEGYQVLVLVPTTILCYQHYQTFNQRLHKFGVRVGQLNRFVKGKEKKENLANLENGLLDILVGTHRILSKDVKVKKLGMLIVDEEQRFGVAHKERLKEMRAGADVLSLSATPIPRTLHMAMIGLREISIIATPPQNRLSVKTYVAKFNEDLIREVVEHEVKRGGQVFFVHNSVQDIDEVCDVIRRLVPMAEVRYGHGQMSETKLESVIVDFIEQKFQVLVCTTIIESGIDMPNVNTIIVNKANNFGLGQLYQLRGRVGRSSVQAYAYFLTPADEIMSDDAKKRLEVIATHQELGSGFHIASHDLEIRGAGNLLGGEQSGHVGTIGLELYTDMLDEVIKTMRGEKVEKNLDIEIKLGITALIPPQYIDSENDRLSVYKEIFSTRSEKELGVLRNNYIDRFGAMPIEMQRLMKVALIKFYMRKIAAVSLSISQFNFLELKFSSLEEKQIDGLISISKEKPDQYQLTPDYRMLLSITKNEVSEKLKPDFILDGVLQLLVPLVEEVGE